MKNSIYINILKFSDFFVMFNVLQKLAELEKDKILHFLVCEILMMALSIIGLFFGLGIFAYLVAFCLTMIVGVAKELYDRKTSGFDKKDLLFDFFGAVTGTVFVVLASIV